MVAEVVSVNLDYWVFPGSQFCNSWHHQWFRFLIGVSELIFFNSLISFSFPSESPSGYFLCPKFQYLFFGFAWMRVSRSILAFGIFQCWFQWVLLRIKPQLASSLILLLFLALLLATMWSRCGQRTLRTSQNLSLPLSRDKGIQMVSLRILQNPLQPEERIVCSSRPGHARNSKRVLAHGVEIATLRMGSKRSASRHPIGRNLLLRNGWMAMTDRGCIGIRSAGSLTMERSALMGIAAPISMWNDRAQGWPWGLWQVPNKGVMELDCIILIVLGDLALHWTVMGLIRSQRWGSVTSGRPRVIAPLVRDASMLIAVKVTFTS